MQKKKLLRIAKTKQAEKSHKFTNFMCNLCHNCWNISPFSPLSMLVMKKFDRMKKPQHWEGSGVFQQNLTKVVGCKTQDRKKELNTL